MIGPDAKVAIFVDSLDPAKRRYSYWDRYLSRQGVTPTYISIPELAIEAERIFVESGADADVDAVKRRQPRLDGYDTIILNWDVANGDFAFGADKTLSYFETRGRDEILRWARGGARVIIEIQATAGFPSQQCYDAILGHGEVQVTAYGRTESWDDKEDTLYLNKRRINHPLLREIRGHYDIIESAYVAFDHIVFPRFDKANESSFARNPGAYSWGNFIDWKRGWIPLLLRRRDLPRHLGFHEQFLGFLFGRPVLLAKSIGDSGGEILVATARIANAAPDDVIDAFVEFSPTIRARTGKYFRLENWRRSAFRIAIITMLWVVGSLIFFPVLSYYGDKLNAKAILMVNNAVVSLTRSGWPNLASALKEYGSNIKIFDLAAIAVALSLIGMSRWIWRDRDRY